MLMNDLAWMREALKLLQLPSSVQEVPVAAILVVNQKKISEAHNQTISTCDPTGHSEIVCLRKGAQILGNHRLVDATLYVTLEPCVMCAGAIIQARLKRLVFGAWDKQAGAVESVFSVLDHPRLNHRLPWRGGVLESQCCSVMQDFFSRRRELLSLE